MEMDMRKYASRAGLLALVALLGGGTGTIAGGSRAEDRVMKLEDQVLEIALTQRDILGEIKLLRQNQERLGEFADGVAADRIVRDAKLDEILARLNRGTF